MHFPSLFFSSILLQCFSVPKNNWPGSIQTFFCRIPRLPMAGHPSRDCPGYAAKIHPSSIPGEYFFSHSILSKFSFLWISYSPMFIHLDPMDIYTTVYFSIHDRPFLFRLFQPIYCTVYILLDFFLYVTWHFK